MVVYLQILISDLQITWFCTKFWLKQMNNTNYAKLLAKSKKINLLVYFIVAADLQ